MKVKFRHRKGWALLVLVWIGASRVYGMEAILPPEGGDDLILFSEGALNQKSGETKGAWVEIKDMPFEKAFRVEFEASREGLCRSGEEPMVDQRVCSH